jgi:AcrR family transcriptional regulator
MTGAKSVREPERVLYGTGRRALLDAAIAVVARLGLRKLTYRELAREAGVSHTLISHHFGSVDALLAEALTHSIERSLADTGLLSAPAGDAGFLADLPAAVAADPDLQLFQLEVTLEARRQAALAPLVTGLYERYRAATRDGLAAMGVHDEELVAATLATLDGLVLHQVTVGTTAGTELGLRGLRKLLALYVSANGLVSSK